MDAMSPVRSPSGVLAIARPPSGSVPPWGTDPEPLLVCAVDVQDPGNLGAIIRVAEAAGATEVLTAGASADPFGWKALRGAMGSTFRIPVAVGSVADALAAARAAAWQILATVAQTGRPADAVDLRKPTLLLLGSEGSGLDPDIVERATTRVSIPMREGVNSLNVAATAALLLYEARRQRAS